MRVKVFAVVGLSALAPWVGPAALAGAGECKSVHAWTGPMTYNGSCTRQGVDYAFCISAELKGNLKGEYRFFGAGDDWVEATPNAPITNPPYSVVITGIKPPGHQGVLAGWALEVFHTRHGDLYTHTVFSQSLGLLNAGIYGIYSATSVVIGGTGRYAGATGWLGEINNESVATVIHGQICTP